MSKTRYYKVNLGPATDGSLGQRPRYQGAIVVADYIDPLNSQRTLLLEKHSISKDKSKAATVSGWFTSAKLEKHSISKDKSKKRSQPTTGVKLSEAGDTAGARLAMAPGAARG